MLRSVVFALIFFSILPFVFRKPWVGIILCLWLGYMNPHRYCYGFAYTFPWTMIATVATIISVVASGQFTKLPWTRETTVLTLLVIWYNITTIWAFNDHPLFGAAAERSQVVKIQALVFLMLMVMRDRFKVNAVVWGIVGSLGFFGLKGGIWTLLTGGGNRVQGPDFSFIEDNNCLALALLMTIPFIRYLQTITQDRRGKIALGVYLGLTIIAVVGTYSRGGFLGLMAVGLGLIWKSRHRMALIAMFLVLGVLVVNFMPEKWMDRMSGIKEYESDESVTGRFNAWWFAWNVAKDRPLIGGGFRAFTWQMFHVYAPDPDAHHDAHSIYFKMLGEHGFPGLGFFLLLFFLTWRSATWVKKKSAEFADMQWAGDLCAMAQVSLMGYLTGGIFVGMAYFDLPFHVMGIVVLCKYILRNRIRESVLNPAQEQAEAGPILQSQEALA